MANQVNVRVGVTGAKEASSGVDNLRDKFDKLQKQGAKGFAIGAGAAVTAAGINLVGDALGGVIHFGEQAIQKASDLNETLSKTGVVFGSSAKDLEAWGKTAARSMGLSENAALSAAASIGNLLLSTGTAPEKIAPMSKSMVQLASDLASFNNIPIEDALAKLQSGLVGQERPLRELGVAISAASVESEALVLGFKKVNGEFSEGEKVQARYSLILKQTSTAQGDFARTSNELANSQRIANAELEDAEAAFGEKLLPAQLKVTRFMADSVIPAFDGVLEAADKVSTGVTYLGQTFSDFLDFVTPWDGQHNRTGDGFHVVEGAARGMAAGVDTSSRAMDSLATHAATGSKKFVASTADMDRAVKNLKADMLTAATDTVTGYYDRIIAEDQLSAEEAEISAQKRILASKNATDAEKHDARVALHQAESDRAETLAKLASAGATQSKIFNKTMKELLGELKTAHGAEKLAIEAEIRRLQLLAVAAAIANGKVLTLEQSITATLAKGGYVSAAGSITPKPAPKPTAPKPTTTTTHSGARAAGGPVGPGFHGTVGEAGIERLDIDDSGEGYVTPMGGSAVGSSGGASTGGTYNFNFNVSAGAWSPGQAEQWARQVTPHIAREFQRQGLIAR